MDAEIEHYYRTSDEAGRLDTGSFQLEQARTRVLLSRFLPSTGRVLDAGGGAGAYAFWLAERGYEVHLLDASETLLDQARQRDGTSC